MSVVHGKVAVVTGAAGGIGFEFAKSLLKNGLKGVVIADVNLELGKKAVELLNKEFGANKAVFSKTDVSKENEVEAAFEKAVQTYKQVDIVVNNAGIVEEHKFKIEIEINCNGVVYGTLLAKEKYFPKYKSGSEGIVVNVASLFGLNASYSSPIYSGTKFFVIGFSQGIGSELHYQQSKTKVLTICPGITDTQISSTARNNSIYKDLWDIELPSLPVQSPKHLGDELITVLEKGKSGSVWLIEDSKPAGEIETLNRFDRIKK